MLFKGKDSIDWIAILDLDIPAKDKIWLATRKGALPLKMQRQFINIVADRAVKNHCLSCGIKSVEAWAKAWLDGTDRSYRAADAAVSASFGVAFHARAARSAASAASVASTVVNDMVASCFDTNADAARFVTIAAGNAAADNAAGVDTEMSLQLDNLRKLVDGRGDCYCNCEGFTLKKVSVGPVEFDYCTSCKKEKTWK